MANANFVHDGYRRARKGIDADARAQIEVKYAEEWNASGIVKRWFLSRQIEREVKKRVVARAHQAPPDALY